MENYNDKQYAKEPAFQSKDQSFRIRKRLARIEKQRIKKQGSQD